MRDDDIEVVRQALVEFHDKTGVPEHAFDRIESQLKSLTEENERLKAEAAAGSQAENESIPTAGQLGEPVLAQSAPTSASDLEAAYVRAKSDVRSLTEENEKLREDYAKARSDQSEANFQLGKLVNSFARFYFLAKEGYLETLEADMNAAGERALSPIDPPLAQEMKGP